MSSSGPPSEGDEYHHHHHHHHNHNKWDVFLSFRGEDIRNTFVDHLYSTLQKSWIKTFKDDEKLEKGESISPALLKAIEGSMIAVVVFSENYASSKWCLDELVQIMECYSRCRSDSSSSSHSSSMGLTSQKLIVIPIFYHVDPSNVRHSIEKEYLGPNFISEHGPANVKIWSDALEMAGKLAGHVLNNRPEVQFIDTVVRDIWSKLPYTISSEDERLVGMESRIEEVTSLLDAESDAVRVVGIWGLGGIGKTTLARAVFHRMKSQFQDRFDATCFLEQVGEKRCLRHLEEQLVKQLLNDLKINNDWDRGKIMSRLRGRKVLLVLDDIDDVDIYQSREFVQKLRLWFGGGSKILITTRDKHSLDVHQVDEKYEAKLLNDGEAIRLFSWNAKIHPTEEFEHLSYEVVRYASGLPLALKILGSALCDRDRGFWEDSLEKLRKEGPGGDILKIGFDGLELEVQETFLDIACFFEGQVKEHVTRILDSFGFYPNRSIPLLVDKSLIYVSRDNRLVMHNLIQEMGRSIDSKKPRRLWRPNDFERLLKCSEDAENIEGILLHPSALEPKCMDITTELLRKMPKLRLLVVRNVHTPLAPNYLPSGLRWLTWYEYPSESLPSRFEAYDLVGLELYRSKIKRLWRREEMMDKLKYINLAGSLLIKSTPDFTATPNLEELILADCNSMEVVHQSLGALEKLVYLSLDNCMNLKTLPKSICSKYLQSLHLSCCKKLQKFPEIPVIMERLVELDLQKTAIRELPSSIEHLPNLSGLFLGGCKNLRSLPSAICKLKRLKYLYLSECSELDKLPEELGNLECLERLHLDGIVIKEVPSSIEHLSSLAVLILSNCKNLRSLPSAICKLKRLKYLSLSECSELDKLPEELGNLECLERLHLDGIGIKEVPSSIEHLSGLDALTLSNCKNLRSLPSAICKLKRLKCLCLPGCSELDKLTEELGNLECLEKLELDGIGIKEMPSSIEHLSSLVVLSLSNCKNLLSLPSAICRLKCLKNLHLFGCSKLEKLPEELGSLGCLVTLDLEETAVTQLPFSIRNLNNLQKLLFSRSSQSSTSTFQFLFTRKRKRQEDNSTRSLVLLSVSGLRSLQFLDLNGCNMLDGAIPSALESLCSLESLYLGENCFVELPSLNQLSRLSCLSLDGCKMLEALPELPSGIEILSADDCPSLRLCVNRITNSRKLYYVSFRNCLQLLKEYNRESKNMAISTLWQQMIQGSQYKSSVMLPGGDIPEWFGKPTKVGHSILLKLPSNWSRDNFMGFGFCVAYDPKYKDPLFGRGEKNICVCVEFTARTPSNRQYRHILWLDTNPLFITHSDPQRRAMYRFREYRPLMIGEDKNISMEHVCLHYKSFGSLFWLPDDMNDWCEMEFSIKNSSQNIASVTQWGIVLLPKSRGLCSEQYDDDEDYHDCYDGGDDDNHESL